MPFTTLITPGELANHLGDPNWAHNCAIIDCRFSLVDTEAGRRNYLAGHIPGAIYAHLDEDLSGPFVVGKTGRHPLPTVEKFTQTLSNWGIDDSVQVVIYDDAGGVMAGRLWWMLRWLGHDAAAVLDGDWRGWNAENAGKGESEIKRAGVENRPARKFVPHVRPEMVATLAEVEAEVQKGERRLVDARAEDRFRGENETIHPRAGHIPGAVCAFYANNLTPDARFQSPEFLRTRFGALLGNQPPSQAIFYCGSGVSACHNLLAMEVAGLSGAKLYVGSWSEWSADPNRPIATT